MEILLVLMTVFVLTKSQSNPDTCPPVDPNCHPWCIEYDAAHCRYCRCKTGSLGSSFNLNGDSGTLSGSSDSWGSNFESGGWSETDKESSSWSTENKDSNEKVKYVIIEKNPDTSIPSVPMTSPFSAPRGPSPNAFQSHGGGMSPFSIASSGIMPMSVPKQLGYNVPKPLGYNVQKEGYTIHKVPVSQPGVPIHCVKDEIICPTYCKKMDEQGCWSCPCAPAVMTYVKVLVPTSHKTTPTEKTEYCLSTMKCMLTCKNGYRLGDSGPDGCQKCTCINEAPATTTATPKKNIESCLSVVLCMLSCKDKSGYELGQTGPDGCPSCKCLKNEDNAKGINNNNNNNNNNMFGFGGGNQSTTWNMNNHNSMTGNNGSGQKPSNTNTASQTKPGSNILNSQTNGVGSGSTDKGSCYPMCQGGSMGGMTMTGTGSSGSMTGSQSVGSGFGTNTGGSGSSSSCSGPFCGGGSGMGMGGSSGMGGGSGIGSSSRMGLGGVSGTGGSGGCAGPFCAMMGGGGGGSGGMGSSGGSTGGGGKMVSPFMAAMSGGGGGGPSGAGMKSPFSSGMGGPRGPLNPLSMGSLQTVKEAAYNEKCFGPSCSAKDGQAPMEGDQDCRALVECVLACESGYDLGAVGPDGCLTCSCKP